MKKKIRSLRSASTAVGRLAADTLGDGNACLVPCRPKDTATSAPRPPDVSLDSSRAFAMGFSPVPLAEELARIRNGIFTKEKAARGSG